jgi:hypothetical protein
MSMQCVNAASQTHIALGPRSHMLTHLYQIVRERDLQSDDLLLAVSPVSRGLPYAAASFSIWWMKRRADSRSTVFARATASSSGCSVISGHQYPVMSDHAPFSSLNCGRMCDSKPRKSVSEALPVDDGGITRPARTNRRR